MTSKESFDDRIEEDTTTGNSPDDELELIWDEDLLSSLNEFKDLPVESYSCSKLKVMIFQHFANDIPSDLVDEIMEFKEREEEEGGSEECKQGALYRVWLSCQRVQEAKYVCDALCKAKLCKLSRQECALDERLRESIEHHMFLSVIEKRRGNLCEVAKIRKVRQQLINAGIRFEKNGKEQIGASGEDRNADEEMAEALMATAEDLMTAEEKQNWRILQKRHGMYICTYIYLFVSADK